MFGPVITTEAHLAYAGARLHTNNTAELWSIIERTILPLDLKVAVESLQSLLPPNMRPTYVLE